MAFVVGFLAPGARRAQAYPGQMCFDASGCGRCEVCVKEKEYSPSGKCMAVAGCL